VAKGQTRWTGFDDTIISMYARGVTTREILGHLEEIYGIEVSPTLITSAVGKSLQKKRFAFRDKRQRIYFRRSVMRMERLADDTGSGLNRKNLPITIRLKSVETFSGVFVLPIPRG